jgi:hypothetical protein
MVAVQKVSILHLQQFLNLSALFRLLFEVLLEGIID